MPPAGAAPTPARRSARPELRGAGTGAWGHIVGTYDQNGGASNQRLWLNGEVKAEATVSGALFKLILDSLV